MCVELVGGAVVFVCAAEEQQSAAPHVLLNALQRAFKTSTGTTDAFRGSTVATFSTAITKMLRELALRALGDPARTICGGPPTIAKRVGVEWVIASLQCVATSYTKGVVEAVGEETRTFLPEPSPAHATMVAA